MKKRTLFLCLAFVVSLFTIAGAQSAQGPELEEGVDYFAVFETNKGQIVLDLYEEVAPITVRNFVNLSEGTKPYKHPKTGQAGAKPYYNGVPFHRIMKNFMIQSGDPTGTGTGGPGYTIADEINPEYTFADDYVLAMANTGRPNSGAAQFFITTKGSNPRFLDGKYTIFGTVAGGEEIVDAIAGVPVVASARGEKSKPVDPPVIEKVTILRVNKGAGETWQSALKASAEAAAGAQEEAEAMEEVKGKEKQEATVEIKDKAESKPATKPADKDAPKLQKAPAKKPATKPTE